MPRQHAEAKEAFKGLGCSSLLEKQKLRIPKAKEPKAKGSATTKPKASGSAAKSQ